MTNRMIGTAMQHIDVYEEIEADSTASSPAAGVVGFAQAPGVLYGLGIIPPLGFIPYPILRAILHV